MLLFNGYGIQVNKEVSEKEILIQSATDKYF